MTLPRTPFTEVSGPKLVCLPEEDAKRQVLQSVAAGDNKLTALNRKRSETYDAVRQLLTVEKWTISDEEFGAAWERLPINLRRERTPQALAKLIVTTAGSPAP